MALQEKADRELLDDQNEDWEEAEAVAHEYDYQQMLKAVELESKKMAEANTQWAPTTRARRPAQDQHIPSKDSPMQEKEATLRENERLDRQRKRLKSEIRNLQRLEQCYAPYGHL